MKKIKLGIIYADDFEKQKNEDWKKIQENIINNLIFETYHFHNYELVIVCSKIGIVNATIATHILINNFNIDFVFNYGAVGALSDYKIGDVLIPNKIFFHDVKTPWYKNGQFPNEKAFFINNFKNIESGNLDLGTGNSFIENKKQINAIKTNFSNIKIFDMEAAAIAFVCEKNKVNFFTIKAVSDLIDQKTHNLENINDHIWQTSKKAFDKLLDLIKKGTFEFLK